MSPGLCGGKQDVTSDKFEDCKKRMAKLEERELDVLARVDVFHREVCTIHESKQKLRDKIESHELSWQRQRARTKLVRHSQMTNQTASDPLFELIVQRGNL